MIVMAEIFKLDVGKIDKLEKAIKEYQGNAEESINEILHQEASPLFQEAITRLMPVSGRKWKGKKGAAKSSKSLKDIQGNLSITITTTKNYAYLYFPNDGTNTRRHAGNKQFFHQGVEDQQEEIINRCIKRLVSDFENAAK